MGNSLGVDVTACTVRVVSVATAPSTPRRVSAPSPAASCPFSSSSVSSPPLSSSDGSPALLERRSDSERLSKAEPLDRVQQRQKDFVHAVLASVLPGAEVQRLEHSLPCSRCMETSQRDGWRRDRDPRRLQRESRERREERTEQRSGRRGNRAVSPESRQVFFQERRGSGKAKDEEVESKETRAGHRGRRHEDGEEVESERNRTVCQCPCNSVVYLWSMEWKDMDTLLPLALPFLEKNCHIAMTGNGCFDLQKLLQKHLIMYIFPSLSSLPAAAASSAASSSAASFCCSSSSAASGCEVAGGEAPRAREWEGGTAAAARADAPVPERLSSLDETPRARCEQFESGDCFCVRRQPSSTLDSDSAIATAPLSARSLPECGAKRANGAESEDRGASEATALVARRLHAESLDDRREKARTLTITFERESVCIIEALHFLMQHFPSTVFHYEGTRHAMNEAPAAGHEADNFHECPLTPEERRGFYPYLLVNLKAGVSFHKVLAVSSSKSRFQGCQRSHLPSFPGTSPYRSFDPHSCSPSSRASCSSSSRASCSSSSRASCSPSSRASCSSSSRASCSPSSRASCSSSSRASCSPSSRASCSSSSRASCSSSSRASCSPSSRVSCSSSSRASCSPSSRASCSSSCSLRRGEDVDDVAQRTARWWRRRSSSGFPLSWPAASSRAEPFFTSQRIGGSTIGGATFMGLCRLILPGELSPKNLLELAATGDNRVCDMLVRDIYGGSYDAIGLKSSTIASTFGKLQHIPVKYLKEYSLSTARESEEAEASRGDAKRGAQTAASQAENKGFLSPSTSCSSLCEARQSRASSSSTGRSPVSCLTQATSRGSVISPPGKEARCFSSAARRTLPVEQRREEAREAETQSEGEGEGLRTQGKARGEVSCEARAAARRSGENSRERHVRTSRSSQPCRGRSREGMVEAPTDGAAGEKRKGDEEDFENEDRPRGGDGERQDEREEEREEAAGVPQVERAADGSLRQREKNAGDTVADRGMHLCRFETVLESARDTGVSRWEGTRPRAMPSCSECDCCMPCEEWEQTWEDDSWSSSVLEDEEWGEEGLSDATEDEAEEEPCSASSLCSACRWPSLEESVEQEKRGRGAERKACERNGEASAVEKVPGRFASCDAGKDRKDVETMHGEKRGDKVRDGLVYRRPTGPDIVRSLLTLMSFNVAQQAYLHATLHGLTRIALVGFLLDVPAFLASLQHSVRFWSKNRVKVFFCSLSPFLGALGASLAHARFLFASRGGHSGVCGEASASPSSLPVSELLAGKSKSEKSPSYLSTSCSASTRTSSPFYPSSEYRACFSPAKREVSALLSRTPSCFSSPFSSSAFAASWASRDVCTAPSSAHPAAGPAGARLPAEQQREAREREEVQTRRTARRVDSSACLSRACRRASSAPVRARGEETDEGEDEDVAESTASHFDRRAAPAVGLPYLSPQAAFTSPSSYSSSAALSSSSSTLLVPLQCGADTPCYETDGRGGESSFSAHRSSFSSLLHAVGGANEGTLSSAASPRWSIEAFPSPQGLPPLLRSPQPPFSPSTPTSFVPQDAPFPPVSPRPVPSFFPAVSPKARPTSGGASATLHSSPYALPFDAIAEEPQEETHAASPLLLPQPLLPPPPPFLPPLASCFHVLPAREESE
uniref:Pantothenate kinase n=3 Tax=Toxoplasma gondii TaxID=5811 RepID=A0A2T6II79_TOXGO|nr:pantothenate kinase [Toxoplasma gondii TgCATBr9]